MNRAKILQNGFPKSGNYLLYKIISKILKKHNNFRTYIHQTGIGVIVDALCTDYKTFPELNELDNLRFIDNSNYLEFPHPDCRFIPVSIDLLTNESNLIWSHEKPCDIESKEMQNITHKVYIVRDGRDVINSNIHYLTSPLSLRLRPEYKHNSADKLYSDMKNFENYVRKWAEHIKSYNLNSSSYKLIKFESLINSKKETIKSLIDYFGYNLSNIDIEKIIDNSSKKEAAKKAPRHFRKGNEGDWRNYFSQKHKSIFKELAGNYLIELGYENDLEW